MTQLGPVLNINQPGFQQPGLDQPAQSAIVSSGPFWIQIGNALVQPYISQAVVNLAPATSTPAITATPLPQGQTPIGPTGQSYATVQFDSEVLAPSSGTSTATQPVATFSIESTGSGAGALINIYTGLARAITMAIQAIGTGAGINITVLGQNPEAGTFFNYITTLNINNPVPVFLSMGHGTSAALGFTPSTGVQGYASQTLPMMPLITLQGNSGGAILRVDGTLVN